MSNLSWVSFFFQESFSDATLTCDGKFYSVHKFVLATCSSYFRDMFNNTNCKHPIIVLKDVSCQNLEDLLDFMYLGEVNVPQEKLGNLIKVAECLKIKGLAVPDDLTSEGVCNKKVTREIHASSSPVAKKRKLSPSSGASEEPPSNISCSKQVYPHDENIEKNDSSKPEEQKSTNPSTDQEKSTDENSHLETILMVRFSLF